MKIEIEKIMADHMHADEIFQDKINRVLFGDDVNEKGMKDKVDEMHRILVSAQNLGGFFTGLKSIFGWLIALGAVIAIFKGWAVGALQFIFFKLQ